MPPHPSSRRSPCLERLATAADIRVPDAAPVLNGWRRRPLLSVLEGLVRVVLVNVPLVGGAHYLCLLDGLVLVVLVPVLLHGGAATAAAAVVDGLLPVVLAGQDTF